MAQLFSTVHRDPMALICTPNLKTAAQPSPRKPSYSSLSLPLPSLSQNPLPAAPPPAVDDGSTRWPLPSPAPRALEPEDPGLAHPATAGSGGAELLAPQLTELRRRQPDSRRRAQPLHAPSPPTTAARRTPLPRRILFSDPPRPSSTHPVTTTGGRIHKLLHDSAMAAWAS